MRCAAFDLGASSGKLFVGEIRKDQLHIEQVSGFENSIIRLKDALYWDFLRIYQELCYGLRHAEKTAPIDSLGVDSFNNDFSLIDKNGELLMPVRSYRDERTSRYWKQIFSAVDEKQMYAYSGNQIAPFNTLMQLASMNLAGQGYLLKNAHRLLMLPDLLAYYITGVEAIEYTLAAETELLDLNTKKWIEPLYKAYDIPICLMPRLVMPGNILGRSTDKFNSENKLRGFDFVNVSEHDTASAFLASPVGHEAVLISSGTWSLVGVEVNAPIINSFTYSTNIANEGGVDGHHRLIRNVMGSWLLQELRRDFASKGQVYSYEDIQQLASGAEPFRFPIDPDDSELYQPGDMCNRIATVSKRINGETPNTPGEFFRCVYDALAMKYAWCIEQLEKATGRTYKYVNIFGGGCQDEMLNRCTANAGNRTVFAGPVNATSVGNIIVQLIAHGELKSISEARELIQNSYSMKKFEPTESSKWMEQRDMFFALFCPK